MKHLDVSHHSMIRTGSVLKIGLILALSFGLNHLAPAEDPLTPLEETLFSHSYPSESQAQRLERLEKSVFGEAQSGSEASRKARLNTVLSNAVKRPLANQPVLTDPQAAGDSNPPSFQNANAAAAPSTEPPDATNYPTVVALERQVFGRDFIRDDVRTRLDRLEKKVFGQADSQSAMADRVDRLLARYPNVTPEQNVAPQVVNVSPALQNLPDDASQFAGGNRDIYSKMDALERRYFNGRSTPNALLTERLDRVEQTVYGKNFLGESVDTRINRLMAQHTTPSNRANPLGNNNRPDIQNRPPLLQPAMGAGPVMMPSASSNGPSARPQNIQTGGGFSSNSTHTFSPEMMSMLPPQVRNQMGTSGAGTQMGSSGSVSSSGSVVIERQTMGTPGFQPYGNAPIQHYNYYGNPGIQTQSQTTTTVIQPNGNQAIYSYGASPSNPNNPNGLPNAAYVGNPAFVQSLNQLEIQVFKQVNTVEPVPIRLGRLENTLLGQMYVGMPEQQRLQNLEKTYRMQAVSQLLKQNQGAGVSRGVGSVFLGVPLNGANPINPMGLPQPMPLNPGIFGR
ncbi:hypothetical protein [Vampirovibrio sp.]|uniref:hypothetical protein n=1 Tax=Vampirovibrio sp. TaxID=2717857 RepID=UPI0035945AEA